MEEALEGSTACPPSGGPCEPGASTLSAGMSSAAAESTVSSSKPVGLQEEEEEEQFSHHRPPKPACKSCHIRHIRCRMPSGSDKCTNCTASGETCEPQSLAAPQRALAACKKCNDNHLRCRFLDGSKDCTNCVAAGVACEPRIQRKRGRLRFASKVDGGRGAKRAHQASEISSPEQQPSFLASPGTPPWDSNYYIQQQQQHYMVHPAAPAYHMAGYMGPSLPTQPGQTSFFMPYMMVQTPVPAPVSIHYVCPAASPFVCPAASYANTVLHVQQPPASTSFLTTEADS